MNCFFRGHARQSRSINPYRRNRRTFADKPRFFKKPVIKSMINRRFSSESRLICDYPLKITENRWCQRFHRDKSPIFNQIRLLQIKQENARYQ